MQGKTALMEQRVKPFFGNEFYVQKKTGYQFNRQFSIGNYIVDFISRKLKLIIEIDGNSHNSYEQGIKDYEREKVLKELGYTIIRFKEMEVTHRIDEVVGKIEDAIYAIEEQNS
jgi:very-short-patch-repair endonuclease